MMDDDDVIGWFLWQVARWSNYVGVATCLKWAPRRAMFATASNILAFWIPNDSKSTAESGDVDAPDGV